MAINSPLAALSVLYRASTLPRGAWNNWSQSMWEATAYHEQPLSPGSLSAHHRTRNGFNDATLNIIIRLDRTTGTHETTHRQAPISDRRRLISIEIRWHPQSRANHQRGLNSCPSIRHRPTSASVPVHHRNPKERVFNYVDKWSWPKVEMNCRNSSTRTFITVL